MGGASFGGHAGAITGSYSGLARYKVGKWLWNDKKSPGYLRKIDTYNDSNEIYNNSNDKSSPGYLRVIDTNVNLQNKGYPGYLRMLD